MASTTPAPSGSADTPASPRLLRRRSLLAAAALASVGGCRAERTPESAVANLTAAFARRDRGAFDGCFADGTGDLADRLWRNWAAIRAEPTADVAALTVRWRAPGERSGAVETLDVTTAGGRLTALVARGPAPLWLPGRLRVDAAEGAALLAFADLPDAEAAAWLGAAAEASALIGAADLEPAAGAWDGVLTVGLPGTAQWFAAASGLPPAQAVGTQAATLMAGPDSAPRIVLNRTGVAGLDAAGRRAVLVHEGVHVATRSAVSAAPLWLVEGVAESVTAAADPGTRARNADLRRSAARPRGLPTPAQLNGPAADVAYAWAAFAVDAAQARWGRPAVLGRLADWSGAPGPDEADFTAAFLAAPA